MQAVILAAGSGSRLQPLTLTHSKPMVPVANKPMLEWSISTLKDFVEDVIVVVNRSQKDIIAHFGDKVRLAYQEQPLGTAHALASAAPLIEDEFILANCDDFFAKDDIKKFIRQKRYSIATFPSEEPQNFGVVETNGDSGGVYVPSSWVGGIVRIELIDEPADPRKDILKMPLEHVVSVIIYGSHARKEAEAGSDIDLLVIADEDAEITIPSEMKRKYDIQVMSEKEARSAIIHDPVFYKTIVDEAAAIINHNFLDDIRKLSKPASAEKRIELMESSLGVMKEIFAAGGEDIIYPIVMRLKEALLIECFLSGRKYSTKLLKEEILREISKKEFLSVMNIYRIARSGNKTVHEIPKDIIAKLISLLEKKITHVRKSARKKGN